MRDGDIVVRMEEANGEKEVHWVRRMTMCVDRRYGHPEWKGAAPDVHRDMPLPTLNPEEGQCGSAM